MFIKFNCIIICWFLVGLIVSKIFLGYFEFSIGIGYIFYPFFALYLLVISIASGKEELIDSAILFFGTLAIIYVLIPVVVLVFFEKIKIKLKKLVSMVRDKFSKEG